ncbi:mitochondrial inner membrane protease subunit 2 isoform X1 [Arvicanthis niloticus]|uniref:mitochondrial inner membrane protease subunit 2 isoform X1 n=1 Tax=Arvicanthis niloticus TaxID=61156 RepID=UPI00402BF243
MAQSQGWLRRCFKAFCKGFFVAVPVAVTFLDRVACVARVEGASMQPSLNPGGSQSSDVVLLNHWKVRNFEVQRGDIVSLVSPKNPEQKIIKRVIALEGDIVRSEDSGIPGEDLHVISKILLTRGLSNWIHQTGSWKKNTKYNLTSAHIICLPWDTFSSAISSNVCLRES